MKANHKSHNPNARKHWKHVHGNETPHPMQLHVASEADAVDKPVDDTGLLKKAVEHAAHNARGEFVQEETSELKEHLGEHFGTDSMIIAIIVMVSLLSMVLPPELVRGSKTYYGEMALGFIFCVAGLCVLCNVCMAAGQPVLDVWNFIRGKSPATVAEDVPSSFRFGVRIASAVIKTVTLALLAHTSHIVLEWAEESGLSQGSFSFLEFLDSRATWVGIAALALTIIRDAGIYLRSLRGRFGLPEHTA